MTTASSDTLSGLTILVVEDDADIRRMMATVLEGAGARVRESANGRNALAEIEREPFNVLVVDWNLGDMPDGGLLSRIKEAHPDLPARTLVVTGELMRRPDQHPAADFGCAVLAKPFRPAELRSAIDKLAT